MTEPKVINYFMPESLVFSHAKFSSFPYFFCSSERLIPTDFLNFKIFVGIRDATYKNFYVICHGELCHDINYNWFHNTFYAYN